MIVSKNRFFEPFVPHGYYEGILGKRILVVGGSYYCKHSECPFYKRCTDRERKDSREFDWFCEYSNYPLHDEPAAETGDHDNVSYVNFQNLFAELEINVDKIWDYIAFTNYVQFFLPKEENETKGAISDNDFIAFKETVIELNPDIVITWGEPVWKDIEDKLDNEIIDFKEKDKTEGYIRHFKLLNNAKIIPWLRLYHPCNKRNWWNEALPKAKYYFKKILEEF